MFFLQIIAATEKIDGCMYLKCTGCKCNWCWQCGDFGGGKTERPLPHHTYTCNDPKNEEWVKSGSNLFDNDGRFLWYMERFDNHNDSLVISKKQKNDISKKAEEVELSGRVISMEFLKLSVSVIVDCRRLLAWSYATAFFIEDDTKREVFQYQQTYLETTTEELHGKIEAMVKKSIDGDCNIEQNDRMAIINLTNALEKYKTAMEEIKLVKNTQDIDTLMKGIPNDEKK